MGEIREGLAAAVKWGCHGFVVQPYWVSFLADSTIPVISIAGFPFGVELAQTKAFQAARAVDAGASEIDIVINLGALKSGDESAVASDIRGVREAIGSAVLKVIFETGLLTRDEIENAARICVAEGVDWLKTCTGYGPRGATVEDVEILREFGPVKASAGIRTFEQAAALVAAGAGRLGTSATAEILSA